MSDKPTKNVPKRNEDQREDQKSPEDFSAATDPSFAASTSGGIAGLSAFVVEPETITTDVVQDVATVSPQAAASSAATATEVEESTGSFRTSDTQSAELDTAPNSTAQHQTQPDAQLATPTISTGTAPPAPSPFDSSTPNPQPDQTSFTPNPSPTERASDAPEVTAEAAVETWSPSEALSASVAENLAGDGVILQLPQLDQYGDAITYALTDANGTALTDAPYIIDGHTVRLAPGAELDFEAGSERTIYVVATNDGGSTGPWPIQLTVTDVAEDITLGDGGESFTDTGVAEVSIIGGSGNDTITAHDDGGILDGGDGNDALSGGDGSDILTGGGGDDALDGGSGADIGVFSGAWSEYTITESGGVYTIIDNRPGSPDGTDTLTNVETFRFSDGDVSAADALNDAPTLTAADGTVTENAAGAVIGAVSATDADAGDTVTFSVDDARFEVVGGQLKLKDGESLDFEVDGASLDVTVTATDLHGASDSHVVTITIGDAAEGIGVSGSFTDTGVAETWIAGGGGDDTITAHDSGGTQIGSGGGNDQVIGGSGTDDFDGGAGNDTLSGNAGNDWLNGGEGDDVIDGGDGWDQADWIGDIEDYAISYDVGTETFTVTDQNAADGDFGSDTVTGVEAFIFNGVTYTAADMIAEAERQANTAPDSPTVASGGSIAENSADGTLVATLTATDVDGDTLSYQITDASGTPIADSTFEIIGNEIRLRPGAEVDFETVTSHELYVTATDRFETSAPTAITVTVNDTAEVITLSDGGATFTDVGVAESAIMGGSGSDTITAHDDGSTVDGDAGEDAITGGAGNDTLIGGDGHDTLEGGAGADSISGGADNDRLLGGAGDDTIDGGDGDDVIYYGDGANVIYGGAGNDVIDDENGNPATSGGDYVDAGSGNDRVWSGDADDTLLGGSGDDYLNGQFGADGIQGGDGRDTLVGESGDDTFTGGAGDDVIDGGADTDIAVFSGAWSDYTITETGGVYTVVDTRPGSPDGTDTVTNVETFRFSDGDVSPADALNDGPSLTANDGTVTENSAGAIVGAVNATDPDTLDTTTFTVDDARFEVVDGQLKLKIDQALDYETDGTSVSVTVTATDAHGATDTHVVTVTVADQAEAIVLGDGGESFTDTGVAESSITGSAGDDAITAHEDGGTIDGGAGHDTLYGGDGDDVISTGSGTDIVYGSAGADTIVGSDGGWNRVDYEHSGAAVAVNLADGTAAGGDAEGDVLVDIDAVRGGAQNDTLTGDDNVNFLGGGDGDDVLDLAGGDDAGNGGSGDDTIIGGAGNDTIDGSTGTDIAVFSGTWSDYTITETGGVYTVVDTRPGSPDGTDTVTNVETFRFSDGDVAVAEVLNDGPSVTAADGVVSENDAGAVIGAVSATDPDAGDTVTVTVDDARFEVVGGQLKLKDGESLDYEVDGASLSVTVTATDTHGATDTQVVTITVEDQAEAITLEDGGVNFTDAGVAETSITGGSGDDTIQSIGANDSVAGGDGNDHIKMGWGDDRGEGGAGDDTIQGQSGDDTLLGGDGNDVLTGDAGNDLVDGGAGNDRLFGSGENDTLIGGAGDDSLTGGWDQNLLDGGDGADTINGGIDEDTLIGGAGDDILRGNDGADVAVFTGNWSDYTITETVGVYTITDNRAGSPDGTDSVRDVETFRFADGDVGVASLLNVGPTDLTSSGNTVAENSAAGTVVATLSTTDANAGDSHSYAITSDPSGFFEIVGNEVRVASGADLDFETASTHDITIQTTDDHGATYSETVTITVSDTAENITLADGGVSFTDAGVAETSITGGSGNDTITGHDDGGTIDGGVGNDVIQVASSADVLTGGTGDDTIRGGDDAAGEPVILLNFTSETAAADETLNAHDGTYQGGATPSTTGWSGSDTAVALDGVDDYVEIPDSSDFDLTAGTVAIRFNADTVSGTQALVSRDSAHLDGGGHFRVVLQSDGAVQLRIQDESSSYFLTSPSGTVSAGEWHHVAVSFGPDGLEMFIDGTSVATHSYTGGISGNDEPWTLGADQWQSGDAVADNLNNFFDGALEEFAVFDTQLDSGAIADIAANGVANSTNQDTVVYAGDRSQYDVSYDPNTGAFTVVDLNAADGDDGTDIVSGVEVFSFNGVAYSAASLANDAPVLTVNNGAVDENAAGAAISLATADEVVTFSVDDTRFEVVGGQLKLKDGQSLDYETDGASINVAVTATDAHGATASEVVTVNINDVAETITLGDGGERFTDIGVAETQIIGGDGNDTITAHQDGGTIDGGAGNDSLVGAGASDNLDGGTGDDVIQGGAGHDSLDGNEGNDLIEGGSGNDTIRAGYGEDTVLAGAGDDMIFGSFDLGRGDRFDGGAGNDTYSVDGSQVDHSSLPFYINLETGTDQYGNTYTDIENIIGGIASDHVTGDVEDNFLSGMEGNDTVYAAGGNDTLAGGSGNDGLFGGDGSDAFLVAALEGNDTVDGGTVGGWTDTIFLEGMGTGATQSGNTIDGDGWTLVLDAGHSVNNLSLDSVELSPDAAGTITFDAGGVIDFTTIERIEF